MIIASISHDNDCTCHRLFYGHRFYHWNNGSNNTFHNFFCKPIYLTYIASRTQRKRIDEFPLIEKAVRSAWYYVTSAWYYLSGTEVKDSKFFKNKIRLFQNVMVGKICFYVAAIQPAIKGQRRERRAGGGGWGRDTQKTYAIIMKAF